ncbi:MAG: hypothetical protein ACP5JG_17560 [Anaerolineae bacterium]
MEGLRNPFFIVALVLIVIVVLVEIGSLGVLGRAPERDFEDLLPPSGEIQKAYEEELDREELDEVLGQEKPPGHAIPYMALLDGIVLFTVALMGVSLLVRERIQARVQGLATLIYSLLTLVAGIGMILVAIGLVILMVSLLLAVPFGTLAYLATYGFFNRSGANVALGLLMALKLAFAICLALAHQRFLQNRGLVLLILTSLLGNVIISFLHGFVPGFLVSITDGIAAIIVGIMAVIWALVLLIGSVLSVVKALRFAGG